MDFSGWIFKNLGEIMNKTDEYRLLSKNTCQLLMEHFGECSKCQRNLEKFKAFLNHPGLTEGDLAADSRVSEHNFSECTVWRRIRRPLTDFEAFLTDEDIEKLVKGGKPTDLTEAGFFRRYFREGRKNALNLVRN